MTHLYFIYKILKITNLIRIIVIFTVGFISRAFINYIFDINIYHDFIHTILSSFIITSVFIILVTEYIYTDYVISFFTKSIYPNIENIKICFIRKIINSYNSTSSGKMHINDSSYELNTIYSIRRRSFNPRDLWEERRRTTELTLPSFRSLNLPPSVYKNEWALANDNRGKDNWDECKFKSTFLSKCNNDFQNFIDKNKNSIKCSESRLKKNRDWFANSLYKGHSLHYALKSLPVGMRDSYKQYLLDLEKIRKI